MSSRPSYHPFRLDPQPGIPVARRSHVIAFPGQGLTDPEAGARRPREGHDDVQAAGPRILIVDDEPEIRSFMSDALDVFGYQVGAAGDADEAFALISRTRPIS